MKFMFHGLKFKRLYRELRFQVQTILLEPTAKTPRSPRKAHDNLPDENTFLSWRPWRLGG
jgi:hypothetical protein